MSLDVHERDCWTLSEMAIGRIMRWPFLVSPCDSHEGNGRIVFIMTHNEIHTSHGTLEKGVQDMIASDSPYEVRERHIQIDTLI